MDLKKHQVLGIIALSLFVIQLILGLVLSFAIGGFIFNAVDKIEDKIEIIDLSDVKVDIIDDEDSIHINSNSQKENNSKEKVLIIMGNDTIVNIQKNKNELWIINSFNRCLGGGFLLIIKGKDNKSFKEFYKCEIKTFKKLLGIK